MGVVGAVAKVAGRVRGWTRGARPASAGETPCAECAHAREAHEHYRQGTDCSLCDCSRFR